MPATWSRADVLWELLRAGRGWRDRRAILDFYVRRQRVDDLANDHTTYGIALRHLAAPLHVGLATGGLGTYYEIVVQEVYTLNTKWVPPSDGRVVDVGANVGVFSLWAAHHVGPGGSVQSFEPNPIAADVLRKSADSVSQVEVFGLACGDTAGTATLNFAPGKLSTSSLVPRADKLHTAQVEVVRLDDVLEAGKIDLLKIDVEGVELEVLNGARRTLKSSQRVVLEVNGRDLGPCLRVAEAAGLSFRGALSGAWHQDPTQSLVAYFERFA